MWRSTDYQNTGYVDSLAATSSFPPAMFSVDFLREALLEYLAGGWLSALKCPAFDLMIGLGVLLRLWRTFISLSLWTFVCLSPVSLWSLSVIINIIITIKSGRLVLGLRRTIMRSLLRQKWSSSFMMIIISWAIKHYDDNQLFDGHHRFWWSSFLSPKGRLNIMMIISSLMFINIIFFHNNSSHNHTSYLSRAPRAAPA